MLIKLGAGPASLKKRSPQPFQDSRTNESMNSINEPFLVGPQNRYNNYQQFEQSYVGSDGLPIRHEIASGHEMNMF